jgi:putative hydrolase of the HAD superfamily
MAADYTNIIFDLGGVLLNLDVTKTVDAFASLSGRPSYEVAVMMQSPLFLDFERGSISPMQFRQEVRQWLSTSLTDTEIDSAWNAMLGELPSARLALVDQLRYRHRIFLLSNTNAIHLACFEKIAQQASGHRAFSSYFDRAYYSHEMGMRKPDVEIFKTVLQQQGIEAGETIFLDDNKQNMEGAKQAGIHSVLITDPDQIFSVFHER